MKVKVRRWRDLSEEERSRLLCRSEGDIEQAMSVVQPIVNAVRRRGDSAVLEYTKQFEKADVKEIRVAESELARAREIIDPALRGAIDYAISNVRSYHSRQIPKPLEMHEIRPGIHAGERATPISSVGLYVPRGRGSFPSMLYMLAVPAVLAGVRKVSIATPPDAAGDVDAACLYAAEQCGVTTVYRMGGGQAIAALAYGSESVVPVEKIVGPGSVYVAAAKRLVSHIVDVGLPAGPSESVILADSSADPLLLALDLMIEAEHGSDSTALLVTPDEELGRRVVAHIEAEIGSVPEPRRGFLTDVFTGYGGVILVAGMDEAVALVNDFAPEHLQIHARDARALADGIENAGEILIGANTPFSVANYAVGANAVLPTGGKARVWSPVSVRDFVKYTSVVEVSEAGLAELTPHVVALADHEGFYTHAAALRRRSSLLMFVPVPSLSDADSVFSYIESFVNLERSGYRPRQYRLDRMIRLLSAFGNPHQGPRIVHVAGSKGKGSTATYIASILDASGRQTGLYMSPHVSDYRERITQAGRFFPDDVFVSQGERIAAYVAQLEQSSLGVEDYPTTFELLTLLAFLIFRAQGFEWIVLEVGIGGRLDATNVVTPEVSVITPIELEHTEYLGDTLEEVAAEKAGIIKEGVPVFVGRVSPRPLEVIRTVAAGRRADMWELAREALDIEATVHADGTSARVRWRTGEDLSITLNGIGRAQVDNAALAALVCRHLLPDENPQTILKGLATVRLPGRMEVIDKSPPLVLDSAHTPESVRTSLAAFEEAFGCGGVLLFGSVNGKKFQEMARILAPAFSRVIITTPGTFKASLPQEVAQAFRAVNPRTELIPEPDLALRAARDLARGDGTMVRPILVTGSFYLAGEVRKALGSPSMDVPSG